MTESLRYDSGWNFIQRNLTPNPISVEIFMSDGRVDLTYHLILVELRYIGPHINILTKCDIEYTGGS